MAEITPSTLDEYPGTSTDTHTRSENRLNEKNIPPYQKFCNSQTQRKENLREIQRGCHLR